MEQSAPTHRRSHHASRRQLAVLFAEHRLSSDDGSDGIYTRHITGWHDVFRSPLGRSHVDQARLRLRARHQTPSLTHVYPRPPLIVAHQEHDLREREPSPIWWTPLNASRRFEAGGAQWR